ncbi:MAG: 30S ribosomal protein S9 [Candidatus Aenigmatarchaeota archaeon]
MEMQLEQPVPPTAEEKKPEVTKAKQATAKKAKVIITLGKRKNAIARATARLGTGKVIINSATASMMEPEIARLKIEEPIAIAGDTAKTVDIDVNVSGGGVMGQADAIRQAIALALTGFDKKLKAAFLNYDRTLLVSDVRRNEPHKPSCSKRGPRRHKQRSKR